MRIRLDGTLGDHVGAKDVALRIIAEIGVAGARGHAVEYAGATVRAMAVESRLTLCNLAIEMGARSGFVAPDDTTFSWISGRPFAPQGALWDRALAAWRRLESDPDAGFDQDIAIDCADLAPQVTLGHRSEPGDRRHRPGAGPRSRRAGTPPFDAPRPRIHGAVAGRADRRIAGRPRLHRLLHQCPPA